MITVKQLLTIFPNSNQRIVQVLVQQLNNSLEINTLLRKQHFIAQIGHESGGLRWVEESLNYRVSALLSKYSDRITVQEAQMYGRNDETGQPANQEMIGNIIYGGNFGRKNLGNIEPGDGFRFKGRGLIQLTGRDNYSRYARDRKMSPEKAIEHLKTIEGAVDSAFWFWQSRKINDFADKDDILGVTRRVNGGVNGIDHRKALLEAAKNIITS